MDQATDRELIEAAFDARRRAHAPYSGFRVGAALRSASGRIYPGCNLENSSFGLTVCAERHALHAAVTAGDPGPFLELAVATDSTPPARPCGACRQVLWELCPPELRILCANLAGDCEVTSLGLLLPHAFRLDPTREEDP